MHPRRISAIACLLALCLLLLAAPAIAVGAPWLGTIAPNAVSSWWTRSTAVYQPVHGITYMTGVSSAGDLIWSAYDHKSGVTTRRVLRRIYPDDHNTPALIAPADRPPVVFYTGHNAWNRIYYRISRKVGDWEPGSLRYLTLPGRVTYAQVYRGATPDTLLLLTRSGDEWLIAVSNNYGLTWRVRSFLRFESGDYAYIITSQLSDGTIRLAAAGHPIRSVLTSIYYGEIDSAGNLRSAEGSTLANIYSGEGLPVSALSALSVVHQLPVGSRARLFDVSTAPNAEIAFAEWAGDDEAEYRCLTCEGAGWESSALAPSGRPIGFTYASRYLGGMMFPNPSTGGDVYLTRETQGQWLLERWRKVDGQWAPELIASSSRVLARPTPPLNASPQLPLLWLELSKYDHYNVFQGNTKGILTEGKPPTRNYGTPLAGDWNGDGKAEPAVFRSGYWTMPVDGQTVRFRFGRTGDRPIVGDWDGDGRDGIGVRRGAEWILSNTIAPASVSARFRYGRVGDTPVVGDWDGDGVDGIGIHRGAHWYLRNTPSAGSARWRFLYGRPSDVPVAGDWDGDGTDRIGVKRGSKWLLRSWLSSGAAHSVFTYGAPGDVPAVGDWGSLGKDTVGVVRPSMGVWFVVDIAPGFPRSINAPNRFVF